VPISVNIDERRNWLVARASGSLSIQETITFIRTARADIERRMCPLLFDARSCRTTMTEKDVEQAVAAVREVARRGQRRGHVAVVADDDVLYQRFLLYETECAEIGVRVIRVFRQLEDAERWLAIVSAARELA
jgi:hypothetical protein